MTCDCCSATCHATAPLAALGADIELCAACHHALAWTVGDEREAFAAFCERKAEAKAAKTARAA